MKTFGATVLIFFTIFALKNKIVWKTKTKNQWFPMYSRLFYSK